MRVITWNEGVDAAKSNGLKGFIECSSKTGENVKDLFSGLTKIMANRMIFNKPNIQSISV